MFWADIVVLLEVSFFIVRFREPVPESVKAGLTVDDNEVLTENDDTFIVNYDGMNIYIIIKLV